MYCSNNSRCDNFNSIKVDNYHICLSCNNIFKKNKKTLINCCKNQKIKYHTNIPFCINCHRFVYS